jgi:hypothetical protein
MASDRSKHAQIIRHIAEFSQHGRIAEVAGGWITSAAERDRACMAQHFQRPCARSIAVAGLGHSIGSPTTTPPSAISNGNATKYVIPLPVFFANQFLTNKSTVNFDFPTPICPRKSEYRRICLRQILSVTCFQVRRPCTAQHFDSQIMTSERCLGQPLGHDRKSIGRRLEARYPALASRMYGKNPRQLIHSPSSLIPNDLDRDIKNILGLAKDAPSSGQLSKRKSRSGVYSCRGDKSFPIRSICRAASRSSRFATPHSTSPSCRGPNSKPHHGGRLPKC